MKKRILSLLTLLCMVTALLPTNMITVLAYTGTKYGDYLYYQVESNGEVTITDCDEFATEIIIPKEIDDKKVTAIGYEAFANCNKLSCVIIPDSVKSINSYAFSGCTALKKLVIPDSVDNFGRSILKSCSSLQELTLPTTEFGSGEASRFGYLFDYSWTHYDKIPSGAITQNYRYYESERAYRTYYYYIPQSLQKVTVTKFLGEYAFYNCSMIKTFIAGENIEYVGKNIFDGSGITNVYQNGALYLGRFLYDVQEDCSGAFHIKDGTVKICDSAFENCSKLTSITIPDSITSVPDDTFRNCAGLKSVTIPSSIEIIGESAFYGCSNLETITIPGSVTSIGKYAFSDCSNLKTVTIPDSVMTIDEHIFSDCSSLENVTIPNGVKSIGSYAFSDCSSLENITIPNNIEIIGRSAFLGCDSLSKVNITDIERWCNIEFSNSPSNPLYNGGELCIDNELLTNIVIPNEIAKIGDYTFACYDSLESITITSIGEGAFYGCNSLKTVTIPGNVTSIGKYAFTSCKNLTNVSISNSVRNINYGTFHGCSSLANITIPDSVIYVGEEAFYGCSNLETITIPDSVTSIGRAAFMYCDNLKTVYYNGTKDEWDAMYIYNKEFFSDINCIYFAYVTLFDENGKELSKNKYPLNTYISISGFEEKPGYTLNLFTNEERTNVFDLKTPITENTTLYLKYVINNYIYTFLDEDGTVLKKETVDYGTKIIPPENPSKQNTKKYTYTFDKWLGYTEGMTVTSDVSFTAQYNEKINKYTYRFLDNDNTVLKEATVDYGTVITPPETPADKAPYTFDYWDGYTTGAELTDNIEFKAVYKYKTYTITPEGLDNSITATYNSNYTIKPQTKDGYNFIGYFTETNGKGTQITNEKGESLKAYDVVGDLTVYPYFKATHYNQIELQGTTNAMPGDTIKEKAIFATDKEAMYVTAIVKYPEYLNFKSISGGDFAEASKDSETVKAGYKYLNITCIYDYDGGNMPINKNLVPFEITFDVVTNAPIDNANISVENITLIGNNEYSITDITNRVLEIKPKLAESVSITGNGNIDKTTKYSAVVLPDYTTDKTVTWSVDNEEIATISQDGTLTPLKNGTVAIKATAKDGSGEFGTKTVNVTAYAKINSLKYNDISLDIVPDKYEYTIYVKKMFRQFQLHLFLQAER